MVHSTNSYIGQVSLSTKLFSAKRNRSFFSHDKEADSDFYHQGEHMSSRDNTES